MKKYKANLISLNSIQIHDTFWDRYTKLVTKEIIPYQWKALNDEIKDAEPSHCISNFQIAAGQKQGTFHGWVFQDSDLAKWLEAVSYSLSYEKNPQLEQLADEAIELIGSAQEENGYLNTYFSILEPGKQFKNLKEGHELYTAGHFIEAAVAYYSVTGKDRFLKIMQKTADLICDVFHTPRYEYAVPGHEEIELALVKLSDATGEEKYRRMAYDFVNRRGTEPNYLFTESSRDDYIDVWHDKNPYINEYGQNHLPVRKQTAAEGHAVRAVYLYCAMADLAWHYQDSSLLQACENLYGNIVTKRMYITGGIGSSGTLERFTTDYDLPNDSNYSESCASIGLALFCRRMAQITGNAKYIDTLELALLNTVLAGIAMDGKSFFYVNPLEVWPKNCIPATDKNHIKPTRQKWFGCACCPPNIARTLASLGEYVCFTEKNIIWINLFSGCSIQSELNGRPLSLTVKSDFPYKGRLRIQLDVCDESVFGEIRIRIPAYAKNPRFYIDQEPLSPPVENGYAILTAAWKQQLIRYEFDMPPQFIYANPAVHADIGKTAIMRGPIVYCLEETDNGENLSAVTVDTARPIAETYEKELLGGTVLLHACGRRVKQQNMDSLYNTVKPDTVDTTLTFVPYHSWGNRTSGEMTVWVKYI